MRSLVLLAVGPALVAAAFPQASPAPVASPTPLDRPALERRYEAARARLEALRARPNLPEPIRRTWPDVEVPVRCLDLGLHREPKPTAKLAPQIEKLFAIADEHLAAAEAGRTPWLTATGSVLRGYRSRLDDTVQPYVIFVPADIDLKGPTRHPLLVQLPHGGQSSELTYLEGIIDGGGGFRPPGAFLLHAYPRGWTSSKMAGDTAILEQLEHARANYPIDPRRAAIFGFSSGGSSCWMLALHHPDQWIAASPGGGFAGTVYFSGTSALKDVGPWQETLFRLNDVYELAGNLEGLPTFAYDGEFDAHRITHDLVREWAVRKGVNLTQYFGLKGGHGYTPEAKELVAKWLAEQLQRPLDDFPRRVRYATYTLRFPGRDWVRIEGLTRHWEPGEFIAEFIEPGRVRISTTGVEALRLDLRSPAAPLVKGKPLRVEIDGSFLDVDPAQLPGIVELTRFPQEPPRRENSKPDDSAARGIFRSFFAWRVGPPPAGLAKRPQLTGPIDDLTFDRFLYVLPTGKPLSRELAAWVDAQRALATKTWQVRYRGEVRVKNDVDVTDADMADSHLVLWGDPSSNSLLARILPKLPLTWTADTLKLGDHRFDPRTQAPVLIFPNPLHPERYVAINSGPAQGVLGTTEQGARLPDFAVANLAEPLDGTTEKGIAAAGFFDETWALGPPTRWFVGPFPSASSTPTSAP